MQLILKQIYQKKFPSGYTTLLVATVWFSFVFVSVKKFVNAGVGPMKSYLSFFVLKIHKIEWIPL